MDTIILTIEIHTKHDVVLARQQARQIAGLLGFESQDQTRIATAVSEIARNAFNYAGGGKIEFLVESPTAPTTQTSTTPLQMFLIRICDEGPGIANLPAILDGQYTSETGMGFGIIGAKRLMDSFHIESSPGHGTTVVLGKTLSAGMPAISRTNISRIVDELARHRPRTAFEEIQLQNKEFLRTMDELRRHQEELTRLNRELEETNRGVLALYAELDEKATELRRANEMKSRFLANMSHEFKTPLNSILALSQILLDRLDGELTTEQEKQVTFIRRSAETLSELVNDLLDIAKIEAGKIEVRPSEFEVTKLFSSLRGVFRPIHVNTSVELIFEEPVGIPTLNSDESKISQILRNLISNALKFTERGEVRVSAKLNAEGNAVIFSVADTGIGIAPEDQERIFEEFIQLDSPLQRRVKGTGLGLPLSKKLSELLGGGIAIKSEPGIGSTFSVVIPIIYGACLIPLLAQSRNVTPQVRESPVEKILIIDDEEVARYAFKKLLTDTRYTVIEAADGPEGLRRAREERPHAIFLDLVIPGMSGFEVLNLLKSDPTTRDIPVIIYTAKVLEEEERNRLTEGALAILSKDAKSREATIAEIKELLAKVQRK